MNSIWFLDDVNAFNSLCPHKCRQYSQLHSFTIFGKNEYIYFEEDASHTMYLIEKGKVKIGYYAEDGKEVVKAILTKGQLFGEKAIFGEQKRSEFALALDTKTSICPIQVSHVHDLMRTDKNFSLKIYKFIGLRMQRLERRLQCLLFKDTRTRFLDFLNELKEDYGYCCPESGHMIIRHPYTQKDIASLIGASRPTLNVVLNELKEANLLDFTRKEIILKNAA